MPTNIYICIYDILYLFLYYVAALDFDDVWISMCTICVCLIKYYLNMLNLTNIEGNHYKYYTFYYHFFNKL